MGESLTLWDPKESCKDVGLSLRGKTEGRQ